MKKRETIATKSATLATIDEPIPHSALGAPCWHRQRTIPALPQILLQSASSWSQPPPVTTPVVEVGGFPLVEVVVVVVALVEVVVVVAAEVAVVVVVAGEEVEVVVALVVVAVATAPVVPTPVVPVVTGRVLK